MTSGKSKKLKNITIILFVVAVAMTVILFIVAGNMQNEADNLKKSGYGIIFGQVQAQISSLETFSLCFKIVAVVFAVAAVLYVVLLLGVYYRTQITIADDGSISGVGTVGLKRKVFSAQASEIEMPNTNGMNLLVVTIKGVRYSVYTDDATMFYKKIVEISNNKQ